MYTFRLDCAAGVRPRKVDRKGIRSFDAVLCV